jgi:hypothetical protein
MMKYFAIKRAVGHTIYRVTDGYKGLTYEEIADKIDCNNWGFAMVYICKDYIEIKIYED